MSKSEIDKAVFLAQFPDIMTALNFGSDTTRIKLDIPATEKAQAIKLAGMTGKILKVTIEVMPNETIGKVTKY